MTLTELEAMCTDCTKCELCKGKTNLVFGVGNPNADIMFIGEGPGENEDLQGEPFVGKSGKLLDKYLEVIDLSRDKNIYIANMVKCRPPKNRDPYNDEVEACINWLRQQFRIVRPKIVVCLGRVSAQRLISPDFRVFKMHGDFYDKNGILFMGTFHPSAILRSPNNREPALKDFIALREKIEELNIRI